MARIKLTLSSDEKPAHRRILLHGHPNAGKTFLAGSMMKYYLEQGKTVKFVDTRGEEGTRVMNGMGLPGDIAEMIDSAKDFQEIIKECARDKVSLIVVDTLQLLTRLIKDQSLGKGAEPNGYEDWGKFYKLFDTIIMDLLSCAPDVLVISHSAVDKDIGGNVIDTHPDIQGKKRIEVVGKFDYVGYMEVKTFGNTAKRTLSFNPRGGVTTKGRSCIPNAFTKPIELIDGFEVWEPVEKILGELA